MARQPDIAPANPVCSMRLALFQVCRAAEEMAEHNAALVDALVGVDAEGKRVDPLLHLTEAKVRIEDFIHDVLRLREDQLLATGIFSV